MARVVLIIIAAQAVRQQVFAQPGFWIPMAGLAARRWSSPPPRDGDRPMATRYAPWIAVAWLTGLILGITAFALIDPLEATATPSSRDRRRLGSAPHPGGAARS